MGLFGLVFLVVALVLIGVGIALGLVGCALAAVLIGAGVVSSSILIGWRTGRPASGIRAFLIQCGLLAGVPAGAVCAWLAQSFFASYGTGWPVLVYGALGGALAGILVALCLDGITRRLQAWVAARVSVPGGPARRVSDIGRSR